ncbi:YaaC-like Protein [Rhizobiales bacterium GAS188]|nr:YaaC-like Protein [Rhizobiales bacterium GAS188]
MCVQQGRLFFEAAAAAPIQIKPLLIYYGVVAFAQAVIVARKIVSLSTLARAHALADVTPLNEGVERLLLRCENTGTFQEFNDAIAPLGRIWYFENSMPRWFEKPFDGAAGLSAQRISITDVLSRIPSVADKFSQTFGSSAKAAPIMLDFESPNVGQCRLRIDDPVLFTDRTSLIAAARRWRTDYPFLENWHFIEASHAWGKAVLVFDNSANQDQNDFSEANLVQVNNNGFASARVMMGAHSTFGPASVILPPLSGGYVGSSATYVMQPIGGVKLSEYSLQFLGSFLLVDRI